MKHLSILVPNGTENNLSSIVGAYKIFNRANAVWQSDGREPVFRIQLAGLTDVVGFYDDLFTVRPHLDIRQLEKTDLIIVPSLNHAYHQAVEDNGEIARWIARQYQNGAQVASICTGAFLLASTGLLDGKSCSTHWSAANDFRQRFPNVKLEPDAVITDENGIYTNGGAYSFLNLMLYLVEKYYDRPTAILLSKIFQIEPGRNAQSTFAIFTGQKCHDDDVVQRAQTFIEQHVSERIAIEHLSSQLNVGRRNFDRRFVKATGNTPIEYAQRVKVEAAKKELENGRKTVNEVMFDVGYSDVKAFREVFRRITGLSPMEYRARYAKA